MNVFKFAGQYMSKLFYQMETSIIIMQILSRNAPHFTLVILLIYQESEAGIFFIHIKYIWPKTAYAFRMMLYEYI